jgi:hypothetical protein
MKNKDIQNNRREDEPSAKIIEVETVVEELEHRGVPNAVWGTAFSVAGGIASAANS